MNKRLLPKSPEHKLKISNSNRITKRHSYQEKFVILEEVNKAWLAAILDGEGCITWAKRHKTIGSPIPRLIIVNTCEALVDKAREIMQTTSKTIRLPVGISRLPLFVTQVSGGKSVRILEEILPFLIVKHDKAVRAIQEWYI